MLSRAAVAVAVGVVAGCGASPGRNGAEPGGDRASSTPAAAPAKLRLESSAFGEGEAIPVRFTCDGDGISPPLRWSRVPAAARELALVVQDRDAPNGAFDHWIVFGIDADVEGLEAGSLPQGTQHAKNDFGGAAYGGPCPPEGDPSHRYEFQIYALRERLALANGTDGDEARAAIAKAALARGALTARYGR